MSLTFDTDVTVTVEMAFGDAPFATTPTWTDITDYVEQVTISRGRSSVVSRMEAGTATIHLNNWDQRFDPANTSSPYSPDVVVAVPVRIRATYSSTTYDLFRGFVEGWPLEYPQGGLDAIVKVPCKDGFKLLALHELSTSRSSEDTDTRIGAVLDAAGWPAGLRSIETGVATVAALASTDRPKALAHILDAAESEQGAFFIAADGDATFYNRTHWSGGASPSNTFGPAANELPYQDVAVSYDDRELFNVVRVTAAGGTEQEVSDSTSQTAYGDRILSKTLIASSDNEALNVAEWLLDRFKDVNVRVDRLEVHPQDDTSLWPVVLGSDLLTAFNVEIDPLGAGDTVDQDVVANRIVHDIGRTWWRTVYEVGPLSNADITEFWTLGSSALGTETVLA